MPRKPFSAAAMAALAGLALGVALDVIAAWMARSGDLLTIPAFAWPLLTLAVALALQIRAAAARRPSAPFTLLAGAVFAIALVAGLVGAGAMFPPGTA